EPVPPPAAQSASETREDDLVTRLSRGDHPVEASLRPEKTAQALKDRIDLGYVHIKFTNTRGGTELGVRLDRDALDLRRADFDKQKRTVHCEDGLVKDYRKVRCIADINLEKLAGNGHLIPIEA